MRKSALTVLAASLLLAGCEGITEPPYPRPPEDPEKTNPPGDDDDDQTAFGTDTDGRKYVVTFADFPYTA